MLAAVNVLESIVPNIDALSELRKCLGPKGYCDDPDVGALVVAVSRFQVAQRGIGKRHDSPLTRCDA